MFVNVDCWLSTNVDSLVITDDSISLTNELALLSKPLFHDEKAFANSTLDIVPVRNRDKFAFKTLPLLTNALIKTTDGVISVFVVEAADSC